METLENSLRWIAAPLELFFSAEEENEPAFKLEFEKMSESDDDPLGQWLKIARARGETKESDPVVLTILADLHRKVDELTELISGKQKERVPLSSQGRVEGLNYSHFLLEKDILIPGRRYYGRMAMPVFPRREIPLYFIAKEPRVAELAVLHERDQKAWDTYVASRERVMIRQMKGAGQ